MTNINFQTLFKGSWRFERCVRGLFPESLVFEGSAVFQETGKRNQRLYEEKGSYTHGKQDIAFQNRYLYKVISPQKCQILFPDGRLFYELSNVPQDIWHICGDDKYEGYFKATTADQWSLFWQVTGPRKSYEIQTFYRR